MIAPKDLLTNKYMTHYICKGECKGVSEKPVSCGDESCSLHNHPLVECDCTDGEHKEAKEK